MNEEQEEKKAQNHLQNAFDEAFREKIMTFGPYATMMAQNNLQKPEPQSFTSRDSDISKNESHTQHDKENKSKTFQANLADIQIEMEELENAPQLVSINTSKELPESPLDPTSRLPNSGRPVIEDTGKALIEGFDDMDKEDNSDNQLPEEFFNDQSENYNDVNINDAQTNTARPLNGDTNLQGTQRYLATSQSPDKISDGVFMKRSRSDIAKTQKIKNYKNKQFTKSKKINDCLNFLKLAAFEMFSFDENELEEEEPENTKTNYGKYFKKLVMFFVVVYLFTAVVVRSIKKIGTKKIQTTGTDMKTQFEFDFEKYRPEELLPFHWFMEVNKQAVVDRMECLINKDSERCFELQERNCRAQYEVKGKNYENCMMRTYKLYAKDQQQFCQNLYYDSDTYYPSERSSTDFLLDYHECLRAAGVPKGKQYCDDMFGSSNADLYKCYDTNGVQKQLYAEDKCLDEAAPIIATETCIDNMEQVDLYGDDCSNYKGNEDWCGGHDTEFFKSLEMCCACKGGTYVVESMSEEQTKIMEESQTNYKNCLKRNGAENIANRFECDIMNSTYDQYQYRAECWDDAGKWKADNSSCRTTFNSIKERLKCYQDKDPDNAENPDSLGFCESLIMSNTDVRPTLQSFVQCFKSYTISSDLHYKCGCEKDGYQFCNFDECKTGSCVLCSTAQNLDDCDQLGLSYAGANDCKLRCFGVFETSTQQQYGQHQCGHNNPSIYNNVSAIPKKERLKVCQTFYPFPNKYVSSYERNDCYQKLEIEISRSSIYEQCSDFDSYSTLDNYTECFVRLGSQSKADACWMIQPDVMNLFELELGVLVFDVNKSYSECLDVFNQTKSAEYCFTNMVYPDVDLYDGIRNCLESFGLPIMQEDQCFYQYFPKEEDERQIITAANLDCSIDYDETCKKCNQLTNDTNYAKLFLQAIRSGKPMNEPIDILLTQNPECKRVEGIFDQYDTCMANGRENDMIDLLNQKLRDKKERELEQFMPIHTKSEFCEEMFPLEDEIDSKITCYGQVRQPLGPQKCELYTRVTNNTVYEFNLFYKYLCLSTEGVIIDLIPSYCLDKEWIDERNFHRIEDCLRAYEASGLKPQLTLERSQYYYVRSTGEEEVNLQRIIDRDTDFTIAQIERFLCQNKTQLNFVSSPFQVMDLKSNEFHKINEFGIQLKCSIFSFTNATRDNLMVYYHFTDGIAPKKLNSDQSLNGFNLYTQDFNLSQLIVNRTDQNSQYFELEFSDDLDLIQVLSHKLYHHEKQKYTKDKDFFQMVAYSDYLKLTSDPMTLKVFETYPQIISQELMADKIIMGQSLLKVEEDANVTDTVLGFLPINYTDYNYTKLEFKKISEVIKPTKKDQLMKEEKNRINKFKVNIELDFTENIVRQSYFTETDILSELGGLGASIGGVIGQCAILFLISYNYQLSSMISRKYKHNLKLQEIKQYMNVLPEIETMIREKRCLTLEDTDDLNAMKIYVRDKEYEQKYELTDARYEALRALIGRHMPDHLDIDLLFEYQKDQIGPDDEFEKIEIEENEMKHKLFQSRAQMPLSDILKNLRERISFFGVYNQVDNVKKNKLMIKKLKYQIKLERAKREKVEDQVADLLQRIESLEVKKTDGLSITSKKKSDGFNLVKEKVRSKLD